jgi:hypothetical protein
MRTLAMSTHGLRRRRSGLAVVLAVAAAASLAPAAAQAAPAATAIPSDVALNLSVTDSPGATPRTATLRCRGPRAVAGGYLSPAPAEACRKARELEQFLLSPPPPNRMCTDIFGGEQTAEVSGFINGRRVQRGFSRRNGCGIADWNRMGLLLGSAVSPSRQLVDYHRTGGLLGLDDRLSVARSGMAIHTGRNGVPEVFQLSPADLTELEDALAAADFPSLNGKYLPKFPVSDGFTYTITHDNITVVTADGAVPAALEPVIAVLNRLFAGGAAI